MSDRTKNFYGIEGEMLRPAVMGRHGMVASAHPLASNAGADILKKGGNAFDAAIATNAVIGVTQPHMCGMGGDVFYLLYSAKEKKVKFLNGSGRSSYSATKKYFKDKGYDKIPLRGPLSMITVPGCVDGWNEVLKQYGTMDFNELLDAAIEYSGKGFPVSHQLSDWIKKSEDLISQYPSTAKVILPNNRPPEPGEMLVQKDMANTLKSVAEGGRNAFYEGDVAKKIVEFAQNNGSPLTEKDFKDHHSDWYEPISTNYRGYTIFETPPNTQGIQALMEFNLVEGFDIKAMGHNTADYLHHMCEVKKLAFADRDGYITDPEFFDIPVKQLLDKKYAEERRQLINPGQALPDKVVPGKPGGDTTYFSIVDSEGNMVSCIQSNYFPFGSGVIPEGTGIPIQNRGAYFSLDDNHVNTLEPHKRTMHTLIASMVFDQEGDPYLVFGTMGGDGQPQTHLTVISNVIDFGMNIQKAIEAPRWIHGNIVIGEPKTQFNLEGRVSDEVVEELKRRGHDINVMTDFTWNVGHAQGILIDKNTGVLQGGADPRGDGYAVGW